MFWRNKQQFIHICNRQHHLKMSKESNSEAVSAQYLELFESMRNLNGKLLAVDYGKEFSSLYKCPAVNRMFFCRQTNVAQQFFTFCCLSSYLINKLNGRNDFKVDSFDDPNLTIDKLLSAAQSFIDIGAFAKTKSKLKQGWGVEVIQFLNKLAEKYWSVVQRKREETNGQGGIINVRIVSVDGSVLNGDEDLDEDMDDLNDEQDNEIELEEEFDDYIITDADNFEEVWNDTVATIPEKSMIIANTDTTEWKLELERILPQLSVHSLGMSSYRNRSYDSEWRIHYQASKTHYDAIQQNYASTDKMIQALSNDLKTSLDKIKSKENYLHQNLNTILAEWSNVWERLVKLRTINEQLRGETRAKSERLQQLTDEDKQVKQSVEEYSLRMTDSSPLVEAKKAKEMLKHEMIKVNLQIGVAIQTLVRHVTLYTSAAY